MSADQAVEIDRKVEELKSQGYGETITSFDQLKKAQSDALNLDERFFVKLGDGRIVEIEGVENNPKEPIVIGMQYKDEDDDGKPLRMGIFEEFLGSSPTIVDSSKMWDQK